MTPISKPLAFAAWFFKRNSGVFVSCPSPVPSPSPQLNCFFPFLKEALRWKEQHLGFKMLFVVGLFFFFKAFMVCLVGGFNSTWTFLGGGRPPYPILVALEASPRRIQGYSC